MKNTGGMYAGSPLPDKTVATEEAPETDHAVMNTAEMKNPFFLQNLNAAASRSKYDFPTNPNGSFAQAMSSIACNAESKARGIFSHLSRNSQDNFREEILKALALKLNFKRQANKKALRSMFQSQCSATDLRQTLSSRSVIRRFIGTFMVH